MSRRFDEGCVRVRVCVWIGDGLSWSRCSMVCAVEAHACAHRRHDVSTEEALPGQPPAVCRCRCRLRTLLVSKNRPGITLARRARNRTCLRPAGGTTGKCSTTKTITCASCKTSSSPCRWVVCSVLLRCLDVFHVVVSALRPLPCALSSGWARTWTRCDRGAGWAVLSTTLANGANHHTAHTGQRCGFHAEVRPRQQSGAVIYGARRARQVVAAGELSHPRRRY